MAPNSKKPEIGPERRNAAKRDRSWSLLMVGDHGQIIPFRRIKGIAMVLITVATLALLAAVGLGLWGGWLRLQNAGLRSELMTSREAVRKLRDEKDLLMAKVVILEARTQKRETAATHTKANATPGKPSAVDGTGGESVPSESAEKPASAPASAGKTTTAAAAKPDKKSAETPPATSTASAASSKVAVSDFMADHNPRRNIIEARFRVQNTGPRGQKVSGRCVLVMKNGVNSERQWVSVPHVSLLNGRPNGKQGRAFRIANFMDLKMQTREVPANFAFDTGTLYVFDYEGKQILEKEVAVRLSYRKPEPKPAPEPVPEPEPVLQPEPESQSESQPERQPESDPVEGPQAAVPATSVSTPETVTTSDAAVEPAAVKAPRAVPKVEPTPLPTDAGAPPPSSATPDDEPVDSSAPPSPPATMEGGDQTAAPEQAQSVDPSLLPDGNTTPAPAPAIPETGVEDTR